MHYKLAFRLRPLLRFGAIFLASASLTAEAQTFGIYRQLWTGLNASDTSLNALTNTALNPNWPNNPNPAYTRVFTNLETEINFLDGYGQRLRAFIVPPMTGLYTFWIASDDTSSLFLSADETTTTRTNFCFVVGSTHPREWNKEPNQCPVPIPREAGAGT